MLKINNICDYEHFQDCGIPQKLTRVDGSKKNTPTRLSEIDSKLIYDDTFSNSLLENYHGTAFETQNGESIVAYYNPKCKYDVNAEENIDHVQDRGNINYIQEKICAIFLFDLNGLKGPNTMGKDMGFITAIYLTDTHLAMPVVDYGGEINSYQDLVSYCRALSGGDYCIPTKEEAMSIPSLRFFLRKNQPYPNFYTTTIIVKNGITYRWVQGLGGDGIFYNTSSDNTKRTAVCIKR